MALAKKATFADVRHRGSRPSTALTRMPMTYDYRFQAFCPGYNLHLGVLGIKKQVAAQLNLSGLDRFLRRGEAARDNLTGVLRRIDELEAKVKSFPTTATATAPAHASAADRLTQSLATVSPAQFDKLVGKVKISIGNQDTLRRDVLGWNKWAEAQINTIADNFMALDQHFVKNEDNDKFKAEVQGKLRSLKQQFEQHKAASDKERTKLKTDVTAQLESSMKVIADKCKGEAQAQTSSASDERVQHLHERCAEIEGGYLPAQSQRIKAQEQVIAQQANTIHHLSGELANECKKTADLQAKEKVQDDRILKLEQWMQSMVANMGSPNNGQQQFPGPGPNHQQQQEDQHQPQPGPSGQAPWPQGSGSGSGPWTPSPSPPGHGSQPLGDGDVDMEGADEVELDSPMVDAPEEPQQPLPQQPLPLSQQPLPQLHQPRVVQQPLPQQGTAAAHDIQMGGNGPAVSSNSNNNGNVGFTPPTTPPTVPSAFSSGAASVNPNAFAYKGTAPPVYKPQINWGVEMEAMSFDPPAELPGNDGGPSHPSAKKTPTTAAPAIAPITGQTAPTNAAPFTPPTGQPAAEVRSPAYNGASPATTITGAPSATKINNGGGSASHAPAHPVANNGGPSSPSVGSPSPSAAAAANPSPKPKPAQKKKINIFMQRKPAATSSKPASVTSKTQTTQTAAASLAQRKQDAFRAGKLPESLQTPTATMKPADDESADWIHELGSKPNPSPFATKPKPAPTPAYGSGSSSSTRTHDTVESDDPGNIFLKDIVEEPKPEPEETSKTPPPRPEPRFNRRKHTGQQYRAPSVDPQDDVMDDGRPTLRPKGRAQKIPTAKAKEIIEDFNVEHAFGVWDFAEQSTPAEPAKSPSPSSSSNSPDSTSRPASKMTGGQVREQQRDTSSSPSSSSPPAADHDDEEDAADREHAQKVIRVTRPDEPRLTAKPKGRLSKLTAAQVQAHKTKEAQSVERDAQYRSKVKASERKLAEALAAQDDQTDYGDVAEANDEDTYITVMMPSQAPPKMTRYSKATFNRWEAHVRNGAKPFAEGDFVNVAVPGGKTATEHWRDTLNDYHTRVWPLANVIEWAGYEADADGYTALQMENIMSTWVEEVFLGALTKVMQDLNQAPVTGNGNMETVHSSVFSSGRRWIRENAPDVV
ncbi:hypothetical protein DHEL01_v204615 [Diaporthe helianthi]|uniref:Uncharacterized protein n=1 Tax=Diaporthe helianthi TaxID=158607 RepID=A0A2P5I3B3_DIAHE|nr:hypothetical protein DHEL01_v204615 [Diaporthe helianthi]